MLQKILRKAVFVFLVSLSFVSAVNAKGVTLSPPKFEFEISPGESVTGEIKIVNDEENALTLTTSVQDFVAGGETGTPQFIDPEDNDASISLGKWVTVAEPQVTIEPGEKKSVQFTITAPANAEPGGHYGTIFFAPPGGGGQLSVVQQIGALVLVRVKGEVKEIGSLETFGTYTLAQDDSFDNATEKGFYETPPVDFIVRYKNDGNVHLKPNGRIEIYNTLGQKLEKIGLQDLYNDQGVLTGQEIVDYIPVNQTLGNVLAKSTRMFRAKFNGEAFWYRLDDGTKELRYKGFPVGRYKAVLTLIGAGGTEISQEINFLIFPWKVIFGYGVGGLFILFVLLKFFKWRNRSIRERIKKELQKELKDA